MIKRIRDFLSNESTVWNQFIILYKYFFIRDGAVQCSMDVL